VEVRRSRIHGPPATPAEWPHVICTTILLQWRRGNLHLVEVADVACCGLRACVPRVYTAACTQDGSLAAVCMLNVRGEEKLVDRELRQHGLVAIVSTQHSCQRTGQSLQWNASLQNTTHAIGGQLGSGAEHDEELVTADGCLKAVHRFRARQTHANCCQSAGCPGRAIPSMKERAP
jgi:hypothetical protein